MFIFDSRIERDSVAGFADRGIDVRPKREISGNRLVRVHAYTCITVRLLGFNGGEVSKPQEGRGLSLHFHSLKRRFG